MPAEYQTSVQEKLPLIIGSSAAGLVFLIAVVVIVIVCNRWVSLSARPGAGAAQGEDDWGGGWQGKVKGERDAPAAHPLAPVDPCWCSGLSFFPEDGGLSVLTPSTPTSCSTIPVATVRTAVPRQAWGSALSSVCVPVHSFLAACGGARSGHPSGCMCRQEDLCAV